MKKAVVVSLINEHERRKHIDDLFNEHSIDFSYFDAINKDQVENTLQKYGLAVTSERISKGEVACYLSHYCLWQQVIEHKLPYLMVFEDDIYFSKSAKTLLNNLDWLSNDFDVIKLETMYESVMIKANTALQPPHKLYRMKTRHLGTAGYIISQKGAKNMIELVRKFGINSPVDHFMFDIFLEKNVHNVYQLNPALCIQDKIYNSTDTKFGSVIEEGRAPQSIMKQKLTLLQKINRELNRLLRQLKIVEYYSTLLLVAKGYRNQEIDYSE
ncbi:glycosyltransferase family 25 protein [uncultured Psychrobacter sp.]|uniref:glycosyltransferase family 25 protein n=1 Tax=uncultured Psychrobacter sp. TaxID=259303 RepID=UPI002635DA8A|nr:glycosyltransferase family 25 protein [uncultured Psychrobacter sp.]